MAFNFNDDELNKMIQSAISAQQAQAQPAQVQQPTPVQAAAQTAPQPQAQTPVVPQQVQTQSVPSAAQSWDNAVRQSQGTQNYYSQLLGDIAGEINTANMVKSGKAQDEQTQKNNIAKISTQLAKDPSMALQAASMLDQRNQQYRQMSNGATDYGAAIQRTVNQATGQNVSIPSLQGAPRAAQSQGAGHDVSAQQIQQGTDQNGINPEILQLAKQANDYALQMSGGQQTQEQAMANIAKIASQMQTDPDTYNRVKSFFGGLTGRNNTKTAAQTAQNAKANTAQGSVQPVQSASVNKQAVSSAQKAAQQAQSNYNSLQKQYKAQQKKQSQLEQMQTALAAAKKSGDREAAKEIVEEIRQYRADNANTVTKEQVAAAQKRYEQAKAAEQKALAQNQATIQPANGTFEKAEGATDVKNLSPRSTLAQAQALVNASKTQKLTKDQKAEAKELLKQYDSRARDASLGKGEPLTDEENEAYAALQNTKAGSAFMSGILSAFPFTQRLAEKAGNAVGKLTGEKDAGTETAKQLEDAKDQAQNQHKLAYGAGNMAGNAAKYSGYGKVAEAAGVVPAITNTVSGALGLNNPLANTAKNAAAKEFISQLADVGVGQVADTLFDTIPSIADNAESGKYKTADGKTDKKQILNDIADNQAKNLLFNMGGNITGQIFGDLIDRGARAAAGSAENVSVPGIADRANMLVRNADEAAENTADAIKAQIPVEDTAKSAETAALSQNMAKPAQETAQNVNGSKIPSIADSDELEKYKKFANANPTSDIAKPISENAQEDNILDPFVGTSDGKVNGDSDDAWDELVNYVQENEAARKRAQEAYDPQTRTFHYAPEQDDLALDNVQKTMQGTAEETAQSTGNMPFSDASNNTKQGAQNVSGSQPRDLNSSMRGGNNFTSDSKNATADDWLAESGFSRGMNDEAEGARRLSKVRANTMENAGISTNEELNSNFSKSLYTYQTESEKKSLDTAADRLSSNFKAEEKRLTADTSSMSKEDFKSKYSGSDVDEMMMLYSHYSKAARNAENPEEKAFYYAKARAVTQNMQKIGTESGQTIQKFAKWTQTPDGVVAAAQSMQEKQMQSAFKTPNGKKLKYEADEAAKEIKAQLRQLFAEDQVKADALQQDRENVRKVVESTIGKYNRLKGKISDKGIEDLTNYICDTKQFSDITNTMELCATGSGMLTDQDYDHIIDIFDRAQMMHFGSKERADLEKEGYAYIANKIGINKSFWDKANTMRYFSMLSGTTTKIRNKVGNSMFGGLTNTTDNFSAINQNIMEKLGKLSGEPDALRYKADRATIFGRADRLKYENPVKEITDDYFGRYLDVGMKEPIASSEIMKNGAAFGNADYSFNSGAKGIKEQAQDFAKNIGAGKNFKEKAGNAYQWMADQNMESLSDYGAMKNKFAFSVAQRIKKEGMDGATFADYVKKMGVLDDESKFTVDAAQNVYSKMQKSGVSIDDVKSALRGDIKDISNADKLTAAEKVIQDARNSRMLNDDNMVELLEKVKQYNSVGPEIRNKINNIVNSSVEDAKYATFHTDDRIAANIANKISDIENSGAIGKVLIGGGLPFKRTPANIVEAGTDFSPIGIARALAEYHTGKISKSQAIDEMTRGISGTGLIALGSYLNAKGILTTDFDTNSKYYKQSKGEQEWALNIPGTDISVSMDWAVPLMLPMFTGAAMNEMFTSEEAEKGDDENGKWYDRALDRTENALTAMSKIANPVVETTMLQGVADFLDTMAGTDDRGNEDTTIAERAVRGIGKTALNYGTQMIPSILGAAARTVDPYRRSTTVNEKAGIAKDIKKVAKQSLNKIPFASEQNENYVDQYGRKHFNTGTITNIGTDPIDYLGRAVQNFLLPAYVTKKESEPVDYEIQRLSTKLTDIKAVNKLIPDTYLNRNPVSGKRLSDSDVTKYQENAGSLKLSMANALVQSKQYNELKTDDEKAEALGIAYNLSEKLTQNQMFGKDLGDYQKYADVYNAGKTDEEKVKNVVNYLNVKNEIASNETKGKKAKIEALSKLSDKDVTPVANVVLNIGSESASKNDNAIAEKYGIPALIDFYQNGYSVSEEGKMPSSLEEDIAASKKFPKNQQLDMLQHYLKQDTTGFSRSLSTLDAMKLLQDHPKESKKIQGMMNGSAKGQIKMQKGSAVYVDGKGKTHSLQEKQAQYNARAAKNGKAVPESMEDRLAAIRAKKDATVKNNLYYGNTEAYQDSSTGEIPSLKFNVSTSKSYERYSSSKIPGLDTSTDGYSRMFGAIDSGYGNGNGRISKSELRSYLDASNYTQEQKRQLWDVYASGQSRKKNPY